MLTVINNSRTHILTMISALVGLLLHLEFRLAAAMSYNKAVLVFLLDNTSTNHITDEIGYLSIHLSLLLCCRKLLFHHIESSHLAAVLVLLGKFLLFFFLNLPLGFSVFLSLI